MVTNFRWWLERKLPQKYHGWICRAFGHRLMRMNDGYSFHWHVWCCCCDFEKGMPT